MVKDSTKGLYRFLLQIAFVLLPFASFAQTKEQRDQIKASINKEDSAKSAAAISSYQAGKYQRIKAYLAVNPKARRTYTKRNRIYTLVDVTKDGKPLYITTKKRRIKK
jgi:hypothetical protein